MEIEFTEYLVIPTEQAQIIMDYLLERPAREVLPMIAFLSEGEVIAKPVLPEDTEDDSIEDK